ncbi:MAG: GNAT family N-acetyltransferase [Pyrinomonadaceae bacterium]
MSSQQTAPNAIDISIENLREEDLVEADHIFRLAFGTFMGLPDPAQVHAGADYIGTRWRANPGAAFAATIQGKLVGTNFGTNWGSVGFFGPLTIHPAYWDRGIGKRLMEPIMGLFSQWHTTHAGLFTFAQSQKHVGLYQRFGFWPRFLTAIMSLPVKQTKGSSVQLFSALPNEQREETLQACYDLTTQIYDGLNVRHEIVAVENQKLGETLLVWNDSKLAALAVCHCGQGSEAGPDTCYVKFGAVRPGATAAEDFTRLLAACESLAAARGLSKLVAGVNIARLEAYQQMMALGFRTDFQGIAMHQDQAPGYNRRDVYLIDDWR